MLTFLRKIRKSFVNSGATRKYLLYAIGEIALVVVGILIALQINNWNENRLERKKSIEYHHRLMEDLEFKINTLESDSKRANQVYNSIIKSIKIIESGTLSDSTQQTLDYMLKNFYQFARAGAELPTYEEMKSSGDLGLIYEPELRSKITSFLSFQLAIIKIYDQMAVKVNNTDFIEPYVRIQHKGINTHHSLAYSIENLASDELVINKFARYAMFWQTKSLFSLQMAEQAKELKKAISESLNNI